MLPVTSVAVKHPADIGKSIWVHGYYGSAVNYGSDGRGYLVDKAIRLITDEAMPGFSYVRLDGTLPPETMDLSEVIVFGEIKDFAAVTGQFVTEPTALITVRAFVQIAPKVPALTWDVTLQTPDADATEEAKGQGARPFGEGEHRTIEVPTVPHGGVTPMGTQASSCDRSIIISGGVNASNNAPRYKVNVVAKHDRMKALGFTDDQIEIFYNDGAPIDVDGENIVDKGTSKADITAHLQALLSSMPASCTLTLFVTDHGTGYDPQQGWEGARLATTGPEATSPGAQKFAESSIKVDLRNRVIKSGQFVIDGRLALLVEKDGTGKTRVWKRSAGNWVSVDYGADNFLSEAEANVDIDGDGTLADDFGVDVANLANNLPTTQHLDWSEDTDRDGAADVRFRWDGEKYLAERLDDGTWKPMGADVDGDFVIDTEDGGLDWDLDGDRDDMVGFHEGINLWGKEVLWDDELANLLGPLHDKGVHVMVEMVSCFSGGFVDNLRGKVENIVTGSAEDTKHYNALVGGKPTAVDELEFLKELHGIDSKSWTTAWDKAQTAHLTAMGTNAALQKYTRYETPFFASNSKFQAIGTAGEYNVELDIPAALQGQVYDFEFIYGLQQPRWLGNVLFPNGLPPNTFSEPAPGGIRIYSGDPIPNGLKLKIQGGPGSQQIRINYTDILHQTLGYTFATPGTVAIPKEIHVAQLSGTFAHIGPGNSTVHGSVKIEDKNNGPVANATVTLTMNDGAPITVTTTASGSASYTFSINQFGTYVVKITNVTAPDSTYVPAQNVASQVTVVVN
ncbi:MAG: Ig-like domain repeat protein [Labilithrix sp.]|nr:Ig-like domain repeat protein [Labilithrix sp.]MCW5817558.1 Ig-like domain repeat protein [Labilithrix sp.]